VESKENRGTRVNPTNKGKPLLEEKGTPEECLAQNVNRGLKSKKKDYKSK